MIIAAIEWSQVSALAACVGVAVALFFHIKNLASARLSNSAKMVLDLAHAFDSIDMRHHRRRFAKALLESRASIDPSKDIPVLQFLEEIGYMTRRGVLDKGMVWNSFFWFIEFYYPAVIAEPNLLEEARRRTHCTSLYREIAWLYRELSVISASEE